MPAPRPKVRPTQGLHNLGRGVKTGNSYLTTCKLCPNGVFEQQPRRWLTKPAGWSHEACVDRAEQEGRLP